MESPPIPPPRQHKLENGKTRHTPENNLKTTKDESTSSENVSTESVKEFTKGSSTLEKTRSSYREGPDQIIPSTDFSTWLPDGVVKIKSSSVGPNSIPPISIPSALAKAAEEFADITALATKNAEGEWIKINYREYQQQVRTVAKAFLKLGLRRYHSVCIIGFNSAEWFISNIAAIHAGGFGVGVYTTNSSEACLHCITISRADIVIVEDEKQLNKILEIKNQWPDLKYIIQYTGTPKVPGVLSWDDLMNIGKNESDEALDEVLKTLAINECCTLVFTSGTVGLPKAVMLSHDNLLWNVKNFGEIKNIEYKKDIIVSYLPLSHIAAQCIDIYLPLLFGLSVYFADKEALKGTLVETLKEVRPTQFLGVPRVWEKINEKMRYIGSQNGYIKRWIADWAKGYGLQHYMDRLNG